VASDRAGLSVRLRRAFDLAREYWLVAAALLAVAAVVLALWDLPSGDDGWERFNDTIGLFFLEPPHGDEPSTRLEIARLLAAAAVILLTAKGIGILFRDRIDALRARTSRSHVIVCGLGRRGTRLVQAFRDGGNRVVAIEHDARRSAITYARERGALVVTGAVTDAAVLERAGIARARCLVAVGSDDATNIELATKVLDLARADPRMAARPLPRTVIQVDDEELARTLADLPSRVAGSDSLEFVNLFKRGAWPLLDHPVPLDSEHGAAPHLLVVGLGRIGEELVVSSGLLWSKLSGSSAPPLRLTVVDRDATERIAQLRLRYPRLSDSGLTAVDLEPETAAFRRADYLEGDLPQTVTRVYVCLDDPVQALSCGLLLLRETFERRPPVVVSVPSEEESAGRFLMPGRAFEVGLHLFGLIEQTCTAELLLETPVETVARLQHRDHLRDRSLARTPHTTAYMRPWEELTEEQREDNRAWARSVPAKLAVVGAELRELVDWDRPLFEFTDEEVERLAELEHERWAGWRLEQGWRYGPTRDDDDRVHPDLVPWTELTEESRNHDRTQIRSLPRQLARAGYEIRRHRPLESGAAAPDEAVEPLARALHEAYLRQRLEEGEPPASTPSLTGWDELPEEFKESSRRNALDVRAAVRGLGYDLRPAGGAEPECRLSEGEIETLAERLHERWVEERTANGWRYGEDRDDPKRLHPDLVAWRDLPERRREIERHLGRELPTLAGDAGLGLVRLRG